jgi:hypothetical protein
MILRCMRWALPALLTGTLLMGCATMPEAIITYPAYDPARGMPARQVFSEVIATSLDTPLSASYSMRRHRDIFEDADLYSIPLKGAKLLVLLGHGTPTSIALGEEETDCLKECDERKYIDLSDEDELRKWFSTADRDLTILLPECSVGYGERNLAQMVKRAAQGRRVIAPNARMVANRIGIESAYPLKIHLYALKPVFRSFIDVDCTYEP